MKHLVIDLENPCYAVSTVTYTILYIWLYRHGIIYFNVLFHMLCNSIIDNVLVLEGDFHSYL